MTAYQEYNNETVNATHQYLFLLMLSVVAWELAHLYRLRHHHTTKLNVELQASNKFWK